MKIDSLYSELDKSNFFLGKISAVFKFESKIQVENISLLNHRRIQREHLVPNTINYYVVIDGINGLFIGQIFQAMVSGPNSIHNARGLRDDGKIFPELSVDVFGIFEDDKIVFSGFRTVGITDKVYIANEESISRLINSLEINRNLSGKKLNGIAKLSGFEDRKLNLDPNTIFNRHLMAVGTTNSGKSTSALSILDKLVESNRKILLIDPTGEYTNSFENQEIIKLKLAEDTILPIGELDLKQWSMIFQTNDGSQDTELMKAIKSLRYQSYMSKSDSADETYKGIFKKEGLTLVEVSSELEKVDSEKHNGDFCLQDLPLQIIEEAVTEGTRGNAGKYVVDGFRSGVNTWLSQKVSNILDNSNFE